MLSTSQGWMPSPQSGVNIAKRSPWCKVCYTAMHGKQLHGGISDTKMIPVINSSPNLSKSLHINRAYLPPPPHMPHGLAPPSHPQSPSLDHHRHACAVLPFHPPYQAPFTIIQRSLCSDAPPQNLCAHSKSWLTQPPYLMQSPLRRFRWISSTSSLLYLLSFPLSSNIPFFFWQ